MQQIGVQIASQTVLQLLHARTLKFALPLSGKAKTFLPASSIQDIVLLEGIQGWSIIWYLAIAQKNGSSTKIHVVFEVGRF